MDLGLKGKSALVTGGSHGIGLAIARGLAAEGCSVAICSRTATRLEAAEKELRALGAKTLSIQADVLQRSDMDKVTQAIDSAWGGVDILVNNVGGGGRWGSEDPAATPEQTWDEVYRKNAGAAIAFTRWAIGAMRAKKWGRVVTISSLYGREGGGRPWFLMAKSAQIAMNKALGSTPALVRDGVTFNTVAPGSIMIEGTGWAEERDKDPAAFAARLEREFKLGRLGKPEEVAAAVLFLCSVQASYVNGACLAVDGGEGMAY